MPNNDYANEPNQSRSEDIIQSILDNTEYDEPARSRIEYLLVELKNAIEGGGGGGGVTSYSPLTEKPKIDNHTLQAGNNTSSDLGLQTKLAFDSAPTENSSNPVTSGGVYTALGTKANSSDVYNKSAVDTALGAKADKSATYTKTEVDTALSSKQNTISDLATIRSGAALGATAVQPVSGKGLSTNDYTNDEKSKLAGIEAQANKTTVDSALSGTSTNPVQNKVVKSALDGKQATLTTAQLAAVNSGIDSDDVEQITTNENNILSLTANGGGRNLINISAIKSLNTAGTWNGNAFTATTGIVFTVNSDNTITVNGTSSGAATTFMLASHGSADTDLSSNTYKLSGCEGGSSTTYDLRFYRNSDSTNLTNYNGDTNVAYTSGAYNVSILVRAGQTLTNKVFRPMLRLSTDSSNLYQPHGLSNAELTAKEQVNENNISYIAKNIGRNILDIQKPTENVQTSVTNGPNNSITLAVSQAKWTRLGYLINVVPNAEYRLVIYVDNADLENVRFQCFVYDSDASGSMLTGLGRTPVITSTGTETSGVISTMSEYALVVIALNNSASPGTGSATIRGMFLEEASYQIDNTYTLPALSNVELTAAIQALQAQLANQ